MNKKIPPFAGGQGRHSRDVVASGRHLSVLLTLLAILAVALCAFAGGGS